jgi:hypothetical protein
MSLLYLIPVILSLWVMAAHELRSWNLPVVALLLLMPLLLLIKRRWVVRVMQITLLIGALEWLRTMVLLTNMRQEEGEPWVRMVVILGSVMVFTVASGTVFAIPRLRRRYSPAPRDVGGAADLSNANLNCSAACAHS